MERRKRRWWTRAITWLSALVVLAAAISGLFQLALSAIPGARDDLATRVAHELGAPVRIGELRLAWRWLWPMLEISDAALLGPDGATQLTAGRLRLGFALGDLVTGKLTPREIDLSELRLSIDIDAAGKAHLRGIRQGDKPPEFAAIARQIQRFARIRGQEVTITVTDARSPGGDFSLLLARADLRLDGSSGFELRADLRAPQLIAERIQLKAGFAGALENPKTWQGRWTLSAEDIASTPALVARWPQARRIGSKALQLEASGDWAAGAPGDSELQFSGSRLALTGAHASELKDLAVQLNYQPQAGGGVLLAPQWKLRGARGLWPQASARLSWAAAAGGLRQWQASADFLRLDDLAPWLSLLPAADAAQRLQLTRAASARGDLRSLEARYAPAATGTGHYALTVALAGAGLGLPGEDGVSGLTGELTADESGGRLALHSEGLAAQLPRAFAVPLKFDKAAADLSWKRSALGWTITAERINTAILGAEASGRLELRTSTDTAPRLKLELRLAAADAARLKPLMPLRWGEHLKTWLNRAIVRARVSEGRLSIDGPMADFPFHRNPSGSWALDLRVAGAGLDYHPDWPGAENLNARLAFRGNGLSFTADSAEIAGVAVLGVSGGIADFSSSSLLIDGRTAGDAGRYYGFLRNSPLVKPLGGLLTHTDAEGPAEADLHLDIALHGDQGQKTAVSGEARLLGGALRVLNLDEPLRQLAGSLRFNTRSVSAEKLSARFYDSALTASIAPNAEGQDQLLAQFNVDMDAAHALAARYIPDWIRKRLGGQSAWKLLMPLSGPRGGRPRLETDLVGVISHLPLPMSKTADEPLPLSVELGGDEQVPLRLALDAPGRVGLALRFAREEGRLQVRGLSLQLGGGEAPAPVADGLRLSGDAPLIEPLPWLGLVLGSGGAGEGAAGRELAFLASQVHVQRLRLGGFEASDVNVKASRDAMLNWNLHFDGPGAAGVLEVSADGARLKARLARLALSSLASESGSGATAVAASLERELPVDPARIPALDLAAEGLSLGGEDFGRLRLLSERIEGGQKLGSLKIDGGVLKLEANGEWRRRQASSAKLHFVLESGDLAAVLRAFAFAPTLSGRQARFTGDLTWRPDVKGLAWALAEGGIDLHAENGVLRAFEPGAGSRVLGLINFYALPRRLLFDFRDVAGKGFSFDRVQGYFALAGGVAETKDLDVKAPSLKMEVRGKVGLVNRDYDQLVTVHPDTSGLTLGAVLLGGVGVAAVPALGLVAIIANQVLDKPLGQATQLSYRVTGPWDNPEIRKIETSAPTPAVKGEGG